MSEDPDAFAQEAIHIGISAIRFQEYLLRRAWGIYYSIWALAIFFFNYIPSIIALLPASMSASPYVYIVSYAATGALAGSATTLVFKKAYMESKLKDVLSQKSKRTRNLERRMGYLFVTLLFIAYLLIALSGKLGFTLLYLVLYTVPVWNWVWMRKAFSGILFEGVLATVCFLISDTLSLYFFPRVEYAALGAVWSLTIVAWTFSAIYALYRAPEMLVDAN